MSNFLLGVYYQEVSHKQAGELLVFTGASAVS